MLFSRRYAKLYAKLNVMIFTNFPIILQAPIYYAKIIPSIIYQGLANAC